MARDDRVTNVAQDSARVENQIGVVHGDANFYKVSDESTPDEKFRVGLNYLNGNMPREAEKLIGEAVMSGFSDIEGSYYWMLAILSGRSLDHLSENEFKQLLAASERAHRAAEQLSFGQADHWLSTLDVVSALLRSTLAQEQDPDVDPTEFAAAFRQYEQLPAARRDEIRRHLEMILAGAIQDQLASRDAEEVAVRRMAGNRVERVWTFFVPTPAPPREHCKARPDVQPSHILMTLAGVVLVAIAASGVTESLVFRGRPAITALILVVALAASYLGFRFAADGLRSTEARRLREVRLKGPRRSELDTYISDDQENLVGRVGFPTGVERLVDLYFDDIEPLKERAATNWRRESKGVRDSLKKEIIEQYSGAYPLSANAVEWLIRWHVRKIFDDWRAGQLYAFREQYKVSGPTLVGSVAAGALLAVAWALTAVQLVVTEGWPAIGYANLLGVGLIVSLIGIGGNCLVMVRHATAKREAAIRLADERKEYEELQQKLADRPTDGEMAAWLDYDKSHIKAVALKGYRLTNRDVLAHVILIEPPARCRRARYLFGPPRYSRYDVRIFLLTDAGVRQFSVRLDAATGALSNEGRSAFRYESITSAEVMEVGVRMNGKNRRIVELDGQEDDADQNNEKGSSDKLTFAQSFRLTLNNTQSIHVLVENFDEGLIDKVREDATHLLDLARDTSGVTVALRILESVAAEGREWVAQEHARRQRRWESYERSDRAVRPMIVSSPAQQFRKASGDVLDMPVLDPAPTWSEEGEVSENPC